MTCHRLPGFGDSSPKPRRVQRRETAEAKARRRVLEELDKLGWTGAKLGQRAKGDVQKVRIAPRLRAGTIATLKWIAAELQMGTWTPVANRLQQAKHKTTSANPDEPTLR